MQVGRGGRGWRGGRKIRGGTAICSRLSYSFYARLRIFPEVPTSGSFQVKCSFKYALPTLNKIKNLCCFGWPFIKRIKVFFYL